MKNNDELVAKLCKVFEVGETTWGFETNHYSSSVTFYLTAIRQMEQKPFKDEDVQRRILEFLEEKLARASEKLMGEAMARLKIVIDAQEGL